MVRSREAASRTMSATIHAARKPHLSRNERISWSLNGFIR
jgi:hypothetical protein